MKWKNGDVMTGKRFHIINGAENLAKYGIFCKPVLKDEETGEQYILALDLMDLLNELHEEKQHLKKLFEVADRLIDAHCNEEVRKSWFELIQNGE